MPARMFLACALSILAADCSLKPRCDGSVTDGIFVHITKGPESPHEVLMALSMATLMRESGKDVLVYFDIRGIQAVLADAPDMSYAHFGRRASRSESLSTRARRCAPVPGASRLRKRARPT